MPMDDTPSDGADGTEIGASDWVTPDTEVSNTSSSSSSTGPGCAVIIAIFHIVPPVLIGTICLMT